MPVASLQKAARRLDALEVTLPRTEAGTRSETRADIVAQTSGREFEREQVALLGEAHGLALRAIAQTVGVIDASRGIAGTRSADERTVHGEFLARQFARRVHVRRRRPAEAEIDVAPIIRLALHVEARPKAADQFQF